MKVLLSPSLRSATIGRVATKGWNEFEREREREKEGVVHFHTAEFHVCPTRIKGRKQRREGRGLALIPLSPSIHLIPSISMSPKDRPAPNLVFHSNRVAAAMPPGGFNFQA